MVPPLLASMEWLQRIAMAHYQAAPHELQQLAHDFFSEMDRDGNGKIDKHEFLTFMSTQEGYSCMGNPHFFDLLDTDRNKTLDFAEVMTVVYMVKSGRPFCKCCSDFIIDVYFTCVDCFENPDGGFSVCLNCYCRHDFDHHHKNGPLRFLDNYTLLEVKKNKDTNQLRSQPSTAVGSALGLDGVHRSRSLPSTAVGSAIGSGSVTNVRYQFGPAPIEILGNRYGLVPRSSYHDTLVYNCGAYHPPPTSPNPSPSTANALVPNLRNLDPNQSVQMLKLQRIAMARYQAASDEVQQRAREVFSDMDRDGDGKIDKHEFQMFMSTEEGYSCMGNPHFFDLLDTDRDKTLDFAEVMTVVYMVKSGRPFCKHCSNFINDVYFTCVDCFENPDGGFSVCLDCYCSHDINHHHNNGSSRFLDNYTLLEVKKNSDTNQLRSQPSTAVGSVLGLDGVHRSRSLPSTAVGSALGSGSVTNVSYNTSVYNYGAYHPPSTSPNPSPSTANALVTSVYNYGAYHPPLTSPNPSPSTANALVPVYSRRRAFLKALEITLSITGIGTSLCTMM